MKKAIVLMVMLVVFTVPAGAAKTLATDASIHKLFKVMQTEKFVLSEMQQFQTIMRQSAEQQLVGKPITAKQKQIVEDAVTKVSAEFNKILNWKTIEPIYTGIYKKTFSRDEIEGMIKFYSSKTGKAVINKMPKVMRETMAIGRQRAELLMPRLIQIERDEIAQLKKTKVKHN